MNNPVLDIGSALTHASPSSQALFATVYHRGVMKRLIKRTQDDVQAARLSRIVETYQDALPTTACCWQPEAGAVIARLTEGRLRAAAVTALFGMHALRVGGRWSARIDEPVWVSMNGNIFELRDSVAVEASPDCVLVEQSGAARSVLRFEWTQCGWEMRQEAGEAGSAFSPERVRFAGFEDVYAQPWSEPNDGAVDIIVDWPITPQRRGDHQIARTAAENLTRGLEVLAVAGERYLSWIRPLLRGVAATPLTYDDMRQSGSYTLHPGVFNCGFPGAPESVAEVLVHEVSHQNYLLLNAVFPLADDQGGETYYSSLKGSERPVSRVLLAYHAAANMALFWSDLALARPLDDYYRREQEQMYDHVRSLANVIAEATGLTQAGQALFRAQQSLLQERGILSC